MFSSGSDVDDRVPVWIHGDDGRIRNARPTVFFREAQQQVQKYGSKNRIGYIVENRYGDRKPMTFLQASRLKDLFERNFLRVIDWWIVNHVPNEYALTGYDTEMEGSGANSIYQMPYTNS